MSWTPPQRPLWVERWIAHGEAVGGAANLVSLDPEELIRTARQSTGLVDFGGDAWREHFDVFVGAVEAEAQLHLPGRTLLRAEILQTLRNRLQLADLWKRDPALLDAEVEAPVFSQCLLEIAHGCLGMIASRPAELELSQEIGMLDTHRIDTASCVARTHVDELDREPGGAAWGLDLGK
jgi:hypothetical protein